MGHNLLQDSSVGREPSSTSGRRPRPPGCSCSRPAGDNHSVSTARGVPGRLLARLLEERCELPLDPGDDRRALIDHGCVQLHERGACSHLCISLCPAADALWNNRPRIWSPTGQSPAAADIFTHPAADQRDRAPGQPVDLTEHLGRHLEHWFSGQTPRLAAVLVAAIDRGACRRGHSRAGCHLNPETNLAISPGLVMVVLETMRPSTLSSIATDAMSFRSSSVRSGAILTSSGGAPCGGGPNNGAPSTQPQ